MTARTLARRLTSAVLVLIMAATAVAFVILVVIPRAVDGVAMTVLTGSMTPQIPVGSIVVDRPVQPTTLKVGDVATYQKTPGVDTYITHRVVAVHTDTTPITFTFKGDANRVADLDPVPATAIRGEVWFHVPYLGTVRDALQSHGMRGLVLAVVLLLLGGYSVWQLYGGVRQARRHRRYRRDHPPTSRGDGVVGAVDDPAAFSGSVTRDDGGRPDDGAHSRRHPHGEHARHLAAVRDAAS